MSIQHPRTFFTTVCQTELLSMCETDFCATKSIPFCDRGVHTGATFLLTPRTKLNQVNTKIFLPLSLLDQFSFDDKKFSIEYNNKIPSATRPPNKRPYHTSPRRLLCIFKKNLLQLQVENHQEILKKPQTLMNPLILPWSGTEDASDTDKSPVHQLLGECPSHTYRFSHKHSCLPQHHLVDREANGGACRL